MITHRLYGLLSRKYVLLVPGLILSLVIIIAPLNYRQPAVTAQQPGVALSPLPLYRQPHPAAVARRVEPPLEVLEKQGKRAASIEEARSRVSFDVWAPQVVADGYELRLIITPEIPPGHPDKVEAVLFAYSDGQRRYYISQVKTNGIMPELTDEFLKEYRQQRVTIRGYAGIMHEGGVVKSESGTDLEDSVVTWWTPDVERRVYSYDLPLSALLPIAQSMQ